MVSICGRSDGVLVMEYGSVSHVLGGSWFSSRSFCMTSLYSFHGGRQYALQQEYTVQSGYFIYLFLFLGEQGYFSLCH